MTDPIAKTMQLLTTTANSHVVEVLILTLDISNEHVQNLAAVTLLKRDSTRGQIEVIRRLHTLCPETHSSIESEISRLSNALRKSLIHGDDELRKNGLELIQMIENYGQISTLLEMLKNDRSELNQLAVGTLRELINRLYEQSHFDKKSGGPGKFLRNAAQIRHAVLTSFDSACASLDKLAHAEEVIEGVLILGNVQNFAVKKVL